MPAATCSSLINEVLDISRIEAEKESLSLEPVSLVVAPFSRSRLASPAKPRPSAATRGAPLDAVVRSGLGKERELDRETFVSVGEQRELAREDIPTG